MSRLVNRVIAVGLLVGLTAGSPTPAPGEEDDPLENFIERVQTFETLFGVTPPPGLPQFANRGHGSGVTERFFRWDAARAYGSLEDKGGATRRIYADGQTSIGLAGLDDPTRFYGPNVDEAIAEVWAEARAGFPNTTFTSEPIPNRDDQREYWRIDLPFEWAEAYDVWFRLHPDGTPKSLAVRWAGTDEWVIRPSGLQIEWDVPLRDDFDHRKGYRRMEEYYDGDAYHTGEAVRSPFTFDAAASTAEPWHAMPDDGPTAYTQLVWNAPCTVGAQVSETVRLETDWTSTAPSGDRALDAMDAGCRVGVRISGRTWFQVSANAKATFDGTLTLKKPNGQVLHTQPLSSVLEAPVGGSKRAWTPHERTLPLPAGVEYSALTLVLAGTLTHRCLAPGPAQNQAAIALHKAYVLWEGCWPEMGVLTTP